MCAAAYDSCWPALIKVGVLVKYSVMDEDFTGGIVWQKKIKRHRKNEKAALRE
jgi:hypothetical protein